MNALEHFKRVMILTEGVGGSESTMSDLRQVYTEAIAALEKQEAVKPVYLPANSKFGDWTCPVCETIPLGIYCQHCGQKNRLFEKRGR